MDAFRDRRYCIHGEGKHEAAVNCRLYSVAWKKGEKNSLY
jgi:hypothetical protein